MVSPSRFQVHRSRTRYIVAAWAITLFTIGAISGAAEEPDVSAFLARVQLLPVKPVKDDARAPGFERPTEGPRSANRTPEARAQAAEEDAWTEACTARFTKWIRHEDELLSFLVPDDPRVRLEIETPEGRIPVEGSPVRSDEISFFRCYRLTFNGETYCLLLLDHRSGFDDSMCFCGHVAYEKYLQHHGALYRFSLLENGKIKKIQVLGEGMRLVLSEWMLTPIHEQVYAQIALSVRWRQPPRDLCSITAKIQQTYGKSGFLEKGMDRDAVVATLGVPTSEDREGLRYVFRRLYDKPPGSQIEEVTWTIPLKDGRSLGLSPKWMQIRPLPPERNSVQWVLAKLEGQQGEDDSVEPARKEELQPLLARVVELLPKAREEHWSLLCRAAVLLAQRDAKDPRVLESIKKRYLEPQLSVEDATEALEEYDSEGMQELIAKRIRLEMGLARKPDPVREQTHLGWRYLECLFGYLPPTFAQRDALILEAMDHPHAGVRIVGYKCCAESFEPMARPRLRNGLGDPSVPIRAYSARALTELSASGSENLEDLSLLRAQLAKEKDEEVVEALNEAIKRLE